MKHIILSVCVITFITCFVSCKKNCPKENEGNSTSLIGTWELRHVSSSISNNYPPGNGNILKFTKDNYEIYKNNQLVQSGTYSIVSDTTVKQNTCLVFAANRYTNRIIYDGNFNKTKEFFEVSKNKLTIIAGCFALDAGSTSEYEK